MASNINEVLLNIAGRSEDAQQSIEAVRRELALLPKGKKVTVDTATDKARHEIELLKAQLASIKDPKVEVKAQVALAMAKLDLLDSKLRRIQNTAKKDINLNVKRGFLRDLSAVETGVIGVGKSLERFRQQSANFEGAFSGLIGGLRSLGPIVQGVGIALIGILLPAIVALGSAALGAAAGVGVLATTLAGALGPAAVIAGAVIARLTAILKARSAQQQADKSATKQGAKDDSQAAAKANERADREAALNNAIRDRSQAEKSLADARTQAASDIEAADQRLADAQKGVTDAADSVSSATVDAYRAMQDAVERTKDAVLGLADAQLGIKDAKLGLDVAQQALADFRKENGLAAKSLDGLFKKFTDVKADPSKLKAALKAAGAGGDVTGNSELDLRRLILDVQHARLGEKQATDAVKDSQTELNRARQDEAKYTKEGINAYGPLTSAIDAQKNAQRELVAATKDAAKLNQLGVDKAPGVVAAVNSLKDAEDRLAKARRDQKAPSAFTAADSAAATAKKAYDDLSASEQKFLDQLNATIKFLKGYFQPATDAIFGGLTSLLQKLPDILVVLKSGFSDLGQAMSDSIGNFTRSLGGFKSLLNVGALMTGAAEVVRLLGTGAGELVRFFLEVAARNLPFLLEALRGINRFLTSIADTAAKGGFDSFFGEAFKDVKSFAGLFKNLLSLAGGLVETLGPFGRDIADYISRAAKSFASFLKSGKGKGEIKRFFQDTLPAIKSFVKFILALGITFVRTFEIIAPVLQGFLDTLTFGIGILNWFLGVIDKLVSNPFAQWILRLIGSFIGFGFVGKILRGALGVLERLPLLVEKLPVAFRDAFQKIAVPISFAATKLRNFLEMVGRVAGELIGKLVDGVTAVGGRIIGIGGKVGGWIVSGLRKVATPIYNAGKWVVEKLGGGISSLFGVLIQKGSSIVSKIASGIRSAAGTVYNLGKNLLGGLIDGFTSIGKEAFKAIKGLADKIVQKVKDVLGIKSPSRVMRDIGQYMLQGLIQGFTSGDVVGFIKDHLGGIVGLAKDLALGIPIRFLKGAAGLAEGAAKAVIPGLAKGGIVGRSTIAEIGEGRHKEAVLPLSERVLGALGAAIADRIQMPSLAPLGVPRLAGAAGVGSSSTVYHNQFNIPPSPGGDLPDARVLAVKLAREMERRGG